MYRSAYSDEVFSRTLGLFSPTNHIGAAMRTLRGEGGNNGGFVHTYFSNLLEDDNKNNQGLLSAT